MTRLRRTPARDLRLAHLDSLELLDLAAAHAEIRVVYDVGANVGTWTLLAKSIFPDADVHAFEPLPAHSRSFLANTAALKNVRLHQIALGPERKRAVLHVTDFSDASSVLPLTAAGHQSFGLNEVGRFPVELHRLDDYRALHRLPLPDLIKLDVQGYELAVLSGALDCLAATRVIIAEVSFVELYRDQCLFDELAQFVRDSGFRLRALGVNTPLGRLLVQTDALFMKTT